MGGSSGSSGCYRDEAPALAPCVLHPCRPCAPHPCPCQLLVRQPLRCHQPAGGKSYCLSTAAAYTEPGEEAEHAAVNTLIPPGAGALTLIAARPQQPARLLLPRQTVSRQRAEFMTWTRTQCTTTGRELESVDELTWTKMQCRTATSRHICLTHQTSSTANSWLCRHHKQCRAGWQLCSQWRCVLDRLPCRRC